MQWGLRMPSAINDICSLLLLLLRPPLLVGISLKTLTIKQRLKFRQGGSSPSSPSLRPPPLDPDYYTWKRRRDDDVGDGEISLKHGMGVIVLFS
jgi:hypothetical protein